MVRGTCLISSSPRTTRLNRIESNWIITLRSSWYILKSLGLYIRACGDCSISFIFYRVFWYLEFVFIICEVYKKFNIVSENWIRAILVLQNYFNYFRQLIFFMNYFARNSIVIFFGKSIDDIKMVWIVSWIFLFLSNGMKGIGTPEVTSQGSGIFRCPFKWVLQYVQ